MVKENRKQKIILLIIAGCIFLVVALLVGKYTYSYLGPDLDDHLVTEGEVTATGDTLYFTKGTDLSLTASLDNFKAGGSNLTATTYPIAKLVSSSKTNNASATYNVGFLINENTYQYSTSSKTAEMILTIKDQSNNIISSITGLDYVTVNGVSGFDITGKEGVFTAKQNHAISTTSSTTGTTQKWTFTLTFINLGETIDQTINETASIQINIGLQQSDISYLTLCDETLLGCKIAKTVDTDPTLYYHDGSDANDANDNSYRFSGTDYILTDKASEYSRVDGGVIKLHCSNESYSYVGTAYCTSPYTKYYYLAYDTNQTQYTNYVDVAKKALTDGYIQGNVNNYVCFGSDVTTCPDDNLYRIIGVFNGQVKLIKSDFVNNNLLGTDGDAYNSTPSKINTSEYKGSLTTANSYYWNFKYGNTASNNWETSLLNKINLNTNYINYLDRINTKWVNMIANTTWNIGGPIGYYSNAKTFYNAEKTKQTSKPSKVGLMYASDYGWAVSPDNWNRQLYSYQQSRDNNWMWVGLSEATITPNSGTEYYNYVFYVSPYARSGGVDNRSAGNGYSLRPVFYLRSSVKYVSGDGTNTNPYRIS